MSRCFRVDRSYIHVSHVLVLLLFTQPRFALCSESLINYVSLAIHCLAIVSETASLPTA